MKSRNLFLLLMILIFIADFVGTANAIIHYCTSCSDCESKINSVAAGDTVKLSADIINQSGTCISWRSSNVEFDCQGHLINGDGSGGYAAIYNTYFFTIPLTYTSSDIIKNCIITNFYDGIYFEGSFNNTIANNNISSNNWIGIRAYDLNSTIVMNNTISSNNYAGVFFHGSFGNVVINNSINNNGRGIDTYNSSNTIVNNTINCNYSLFVS